MNVIAQFIFGILMILTMVVVGGASGWLIREGVISITNRQVLPTILYCINGKLYERISDTYVIIEPSRTCIPVNTTLK